MVRSRSHRDMALEAISRSRFFAFCAKDPANHICSPCSACSAYIGQGRGKCSGYRRSTLTNLKEIYRGVMGGRHWPPALPGKSATSATQCTTRIIEGSLPFYLSRQQLKRAICLAVCADGNNQLGPELLAFSQRMNRDITSSASSPPSIDINSMWACWLISQSVRSCALCKYLMIGWSASTNNIVQVVTPGGLTLRGGPWTSVAYDQRVLKEYFL
jgi:hypothetical protein